MGLENALSEITLVLFTTLAPSGVVACIIVGVHLLFSRSPADQHVLLSKFLAIPVLVALVGLVASATHLGNPSNALYVLAGVGRSPLSNEVFSGVVFFGLVGSYWFYSFSRTRRAMLERVWISLFSVAGLVFVAGIALAYDVATIVTWHNALVPVALVLNSLVGGPLLALGTFAAASRSAGGESLVQPGVARACITLSFVATVANALCYAMQAAAFSGLSNSVVTFNQLAPAYPMAMAAFAVLCLAAVAVDALMMRRAGRVLLPDTMVAVALSFIGIFIMRFMFYMTHMTVGLAY